MEQAKQIITAMHPSSQPQKIMLAPKFSGKGSELGTFLEKMKQYRLSLEKQQH